MELVHFEIVVFIVHHKQLLTCFLFFKDILPKKILASKYLKMLKEKREEEEEEDDGEESDTGEVLA